MTTKSLLSNIMVFSVGVSIGGVVAWKLTKTKYEQIADSEILEMQKYYETKYEDRNLKQTIEKMEEDDSYENRSKDVNNSEKARDMAVVKTIIDSAEYASPPDDDYCKDEEDCLDMEDPYVISPDEYDDGEYNKETLVYYSDGVLADAYDTIIQNPDELIGPDSLKTFGLYEKDTVYVRNDTKEIDYEICKDRRKSFEVL